MNVIKPRANVTVPRPPAAWGAKLEVLKAKLAAFYGHHHPMTSVIGEDSPGRHAVHCVYSFGLGTIMEGKHLPETAPFCWRFLAGGHKNMTTAAGCMASDGLGKSAEPRVMATWETPEAAELLRDTESLNKKFERLNEDSYELRVLRIPALYIEAFWLKLLNSSRGRRRGSESPGDLIVPYGLLVADGRIKLNSGTTLKKNEVYSVAKFLETIRGAASQRLKFDDHKLTRAASAHAGRLAQ